MLYHYLRKTIYYPDSEFSYWIMKKRKKKKKIVERGCLEKKIINLNGKTKTSAVSEFSPMLLLFAKLHQALLISLLNKCFIKESNKVHKCLYF